MRILGGRLEEYRWGNRREEGLGREVRRRGKRIEEEEKMREGI
jgi:hypothetical protein